MNYSPELTGIGKYSGEMGAWLSKHEHDVRVITAPPYYPEWKVKDGYSPLKYRVDNILGVTVFRCPTWIPRKLSGIKRLLHLISFAMSSSLVAFRQISWKPDVVIVIEPTFFCAPTALFVSKLSKAKAWLHIQDFEVDAAFELGILKSEKLYSIALAIESFFLKSFDRVSTISVKMLEQLKNKSVSSEKCILFPNWIDCDSIYPLEHTRYYRDKLGLDDECKIVLYSGNMGEKQGLEIIIDAAVLLRDQNIQFVLCGHGTMLQKLHDLSADLKNINWMPLQPLSRLNDLLNLADIHLLPQRSDVTDLVMPSKLTGMLASGKPIIATSEKDSQISRIVKNCGIITPPGDAALFAKAIKELAFDESMIREFGENARNFAIRELNQTEILNGFNVELFKTLKENN